MDAARKTAMESVTHDLEVYARHHERTRVLDGMRSSSSRHQLGLRQAVNPGGSCPSVLPQLDRDSRGYA